MRMLSMHKYASMKCAVDLMLQHMQVQLWIMEDVKVYNAMIVVPTSMYGSETWVLNKQQESVAQATEMRILQRIAE